MRCQFTACDVHWSKVSHRVKLHTMIPKPSFLLDKKIRPQANHEAGMNKQNRSVQFASSSNINHLRPSSHRNNPPPANTRCTFKGCKFAGPPDVVDFHNKFQHMELRNRYNVDFMLNSPEDIARWRAERRARYPTFENAEKKDITDTSDKVSSGKLNEAKRYQNRNEHSNWKNNNNRCNNTKRKQNYFQNQHTNYDSFNIKRNRLDQDLLSSKVLNTADSENDTEKNFPAKEEKSNSLNLLSYYGSDEETDNMDAFRKEPLEKTNRNTSPIKETVNTDNSEQIIAKLVSDLLHKVQCNLTASTANEINSKTVKPKKRKRPFVAPSLTYSKLSLFQKLMLQDIRKIKPDLLQCLQLIVDNQFLQAN